MRSDRDTERARTGGGKEKKSIVRSKNLHRGHGADGQQRRQRQAVLGKFSAFFAKTTQDKFKRNADNKISRRKKRKKLMRRSNKKSEIQEPKPGKRPRATPSSEAKKIPDHPFETEFGDHFATSLSSLKDIKPVLDWLCAKDHVSIIYDPYYCDGAVKRHLTSLGFPENNVVHQNRDFYRDVKTGQVPNHDILLTNPPYSGDHKARILEFALNKNKGRPWALLVPSYCVTKQWFKQSIDTHLKFSHHRPFFIVPKERYTYAHPTGKGHSSSPFESIWIVGAWDDTEALFSHSKRHLDHAWVARTANELSRNRVDGVRMARRKNPRARRKARRKRVSRVE